MWLLTLPHAGAPIPANRRACCGASLAGEPPLNDFPGGPHRVNRQYSAAYAIHECFTLAQPGEALGVTRHEHGLLLSVHLAAHLVRRDYPAASGFGRQTLDR